MTSDHWPISVKLESITSNNSDLASSINNSSSKFNYKKAYWD